MNLSIKSHLQNSFYIDLRSLGLFRIFLGIIFIVDVIFRLSDFKEFYTDEGILPRAVLLNEAWILNLKWSVFNLTGNEVIFFLFFIAIIILSLLLIVGYKIKWTIFFLWILIVSMNNRNPLILNGGDVMLQLLLFWSFFLPLSERFTFKKSMEVKNKLISIPVLAIIAQIGFIYLFSALMKDFTIWIKEGTALYYALNFDLMVKPLGKTLLHYPILLRYLSIFIYSLELLGPLLLLIPFKVKIIRTTIVVLFFLFHLATTFVFELGVFPYIGMAAWILLLPSSFWDNFVAKIFPSQKSISREVLKKFNYFHLVPAFLIVYVFIWNFRSLDMEKFQKYFPVRAGFVGQVFQLQQKWGMFAPFPHTADGYFLLVLNFSDNSSVDLLRGNQLVKLDKRETVLSKYDTKRWQKYFLSMYFDKRRRYSKYFLAYVCKELKKSNQQYESIQSIEFIYMKETTPAPGNSPIPLEKKVIEKCDCKF